MIRTLAILMVALAIAGCRGNTPTGQHPQAGVVPWSDYTSGLQARIDGLAAAKNCGGLQAEFNTADANNEATRARTGHSNSDLMKYIDDAMRAAGCY